MSAVQHSDYRHHIIYDVASYHVGKSLVDVARNSLTGGKIRSGDHHLDRSRPLIHQFYAGLPNNERNAVHNGYQKAVSARERIESAHGFRKIFMAKEYEEVAKHLFIIVDLSEAIVGRGAYSPPPGPPSLPSLPRTTSTLSIPFGISYEEPPAADVDVGTLNQVEMSIFESGTTGEAAIVLELRGRDGTTQEVAATIPLAALSGAGDEIETCSVTSFDSSGCVILGPHSEVGDE